MLPKQQGDKLVNNLYLTSWTSVCSLQSHEAQAALAGYPVATYLCAQQDNCTRNCTLLSAQTGNRVWHKAPAANSQSHRQDWERAWLCWAQFHGSDPRTLPSRAAAGSSSRGSSAALPCLQTLIPSTSGFTFLLSSKQKETSNRTGVQGQYFEDTKTGCPSDIGRKGSSSHQALCPTASTLSHRNCQRCLSD